MNRLNNLLSCLDSYKNKVTEENPCIIKFLLNSIREVTTELSKDLISGSSAVLWPKIKLLKQKCVSLHQKLIPALKSCVHKFMNSGPGFGVNNHDVKFRLVEIVLVCDLDYLIRHHLAKTAATMKLNVRSLTIQWISGVSRFFFWAYRFS